MIQGTEEWRLARTGKVTASRIADIIARTKSGYSASRANYLAELVVERLTGLPYDNGFESEDMRWGKLYEPAARERYEVENFEEVELVGLIDHPTISKAAASPDGLVGDYGLLEVKAPKTATHIETLLSEKVPARYDTQIHWQAACTGRSWADFVSYDPRCPTHLQYFCQRIEIDPAYVVELEGEVRKFLAELDSKVEALQARYGRAA